MTVSQKKVSLINWITNLDDEQLLDQMIGFRQKSLEELPNAIVKLLHTAEAEPEEKLKKHTNVRDMLEKK